MKTQMLCKPALPVSQIGWENLREILQGRKTLKEVLAAEKRGPDVALNRLPADALVGFLPESGATGTIVVTRAKSAGDSVPAVSLGLQGEQWNAVPANMPCGILQQWPCVIVPRLRWIEVLIEITERHLREGSDCGDFDWKHWTIALRWEHWEARRLDWLPRAIDLARVMNVRDMLANTLQQTCNRIGLRKGEI